MLIHTRRTDSDEGEESSPYTALVSGPCWSVPLKPSELGDFVGMLSQLRLMVANLAAQGQWHGGTADRPASRVKVGTCGARLVRLCVPVVCVQTAVFCVSRKRRGTA
jgi:hypothetical protein